jgi:hypothetical protein
MTKWFRAARGWNIRYGETWMVQWQIAGWFSFGIHIDFKKREVSSGPFEGLSYGPYIDLHLFCFIISFGRRPYLSGSLMNESGIARGGYSVHTDEDLVVERINWRYRTFVEIVLIILLLMNFLEVFLKVKDGDFF